MNRSLYGLTGCLVLILALAMLLPAFAAKAPGPDVNRLASYLPADTHAYVEIPSVPAALEALAQHPFARLLEDEEVSAFSGFYLGLARGFVNRFLSRSIGADLGEIRALGTGRIELALTAIDLADPTAGLRAAMAVDVTGSEEKAREVVGRLIDLLIEIGYSAKVIELGSVKAVECTGQPTVFAFFTRGRFIATTDRALALRFAEGKPLETPRLADTPAFNRVAGHIRAEGSHAYVYLDWGRLFEQALEYTSREQSPEKVAEFRELVKASGLRNLRRYGASVRFGPHGVREFDHIDIDGPPVGFARLVGTVGTGLDLPAHMGAGTLFYHGGRIDLAGAWDVLRETWRVIAERSSESFPKDALAQLDALDSGSLGFKLRDDLLVALGDEYGVAVGLSPSGGVIPEMVAVIKVKDPDRVRAVIEALVERLAEKDVRVTTGRLGETEYRVIRDSRPGLTPSVAVRDDVVALGLTVQSLKRFLRPSGPRLPAARSYGTALAAVGLQDLESVSFLTYLDLPQALIYGYNMGVPALSMLDTGSLPFELDLAALPTAETLAAGFSPVISAKRIGADGLTTETISPVPLGLVWLAGPVLGSVGTTAQMPIPMPAPPPSDRE